MRTRSTKFFIIGLFIFLLVVTGVYAIFTTTINITGTTTGTASFKIVFDSATVSDTGKANYSISTDGITLTISSNLSYPGDTATVNFTIKNTGTLPARVDDIVFTNPSSTDLIVQIIGLESINGTILPVGGTTTGSVKTTWNSTSTIQDPDDINFNLQIYYSQAT